MLLVLLVLLLLLLSIVLIIVVIVIVVIANVPVFAKYTVFLLLFVVEKPKPMK